MIAPPSPAEIASERLARSRDKLRMALRRNQATGPTGVPAQDWLKDIKHLKSLPGLGVVMAAFQAWWPHQPLRLAGVTASVAATTLLKPLAQRHPLYFALTGLVVGALAVKLKPWRWIPATAIASGLAPRAIGNILKSLPFQAWLASVAGSIAAQDKKVPPA